VATDAGKDGKPSSIDLANRAANGFGQRDAETPTECIRNRRLDAISLRRISYSIGYDLERCRMQLRVVK
jgi:hypothetical protein